MIPPQNRRKCRDCITISFFDSHALLYDEGVKLLFAQGNPGTKYDGTRHNVGFYMLDTFAQAQGAIWNEKSKFHAVIAETTVEGEKVILAKPMTFYNETGKSIRALVDFYKLDPATDVLVLHDELALPFGTLRTRSSGSDAGNNGIKSLNTAIGQDYLRLRIGIWNEWRDRSNDIDFVVGKFTASEAGRLIDLYALAEPQIDHFIAGSHADDTIKLPPTE